MVINPSINGAAVNAALETMLAIELFLNENYFFRRNVLNGKVEFAVKPKGEAEFAIRPDADVPPDEAGPEASDASLNWRPLTPEALNSIVRKAKKEQVCEKGSPKTEIMEFVHSEDVPVHNPIGDYLKRLPEWDGKNVIVSGGSQGGALTIVTAALNEKVTCCAPFYPALCDFTGFLHHRAGGWPKFFSGFYKDGRIDVPQEQAVETLQYFDVVNFARLLKVPTFMSWGYNDDTCSPTSVWAAWNEIGSPKVSDITPSSGHWRFPVSQDRCQEWIEQQIK